jgi:hypothetical protein
MISDPHASSVSPPAFQPHTSHHIMILLQFLLFLSFFLVDQVLAHVTL